MSSTGGAFTGTLTADWPATDRLVAEWLPDCDGEFGVSNDSATAVVASNVITMPAATD